MYYPSQAKLIRAKKVIEAPGSFKPLKAEVKLYNQGVAEKLEGDKLVDFIYNGLGGAKVLEGAKAEEAESKSRAAKARSAKVNKRAIRRTKIEVK